MPFNCWCLTCKNPIGMGVRYNAEKKKVGMYHSTPIYQFSMPCHLCAGTILFQTDPKNFQYIILEGARRKVQKWDAEENEQVLIADHSEKKQLATDAMYHLEHDFTDKKKANDVMPVVGELQINRLAYEDDFALNQIARKKFREAKKLSQEEMVKDKALLNRLSLSGSEVKLLPENDEDTTMAKVIQLTHAKHNVKSNRLNPISFIQSRNPCISSTKTSSNITKRTTNTAVKKFPKTKSNSAVQNLCDIKKSEKYNSCETKECKIPEQKNSKRNVNIFSSLSDDHTVSLLKGSSIELVSYESSDDSHSNNDV
ncbi:unnamed protein product [Heterobilharzia americana]|nr:unnamed protein product [Heterobilharzia americana]